MFNECAQKEIFAGWEKAKEIILVGKSESIEMDTTIGEGDYTRI